MNHDPHRELFDELYPAADGGPNCDLVLGMVRERRRARHYGQAALLSLLIMLGGAVAFSLRDTSPKPLPALAAKPPVQVRNVNDEELLDLLNGQQAAIATLPDGTQRLLLLVRLKR
jgi:hypothetical protein